MHANIQLALVGGLAGALYALLAAGLLIEYRSSRILNFAQGALATFAAFFYYHAKDSWGLPTWAAVVLGVAVTAAIGGTFQGLVLQRLRYAPPLARVISTLGLMIAVTAAIALLFGTLVPRPAPF